MACGVEKVVSDSIIRVWEYYTLLDYWVQLYKMNTV